jgi:YD repeat-containing protein
MVSKRICSPHLKCLEWFTSVVITITRHWQMTRCESESDSRPRRCASASSESLRPALTGPCGTGTSGLGLDPALPKAERPRCGPRRGPRGPLALAGPWPYGPKFRGPAGPGPQARPHWQARVGHRQWQAWRCGPRARSRSCPGRSESPSVPETRGFNLFACQCQRYHDTAATSRTLACDDHDRTVTRTVRANRTRPSARL